MAARWTSLLIWAVVAATVVAWGLRLGAGAQPVPPQAVTVGMAPPAGADLARLLGTAPPAPVVVEAPLPADSRFKLLGVVAPRAGQTGSGLALISVDGRPARAVAAGHELEPGLRVLRVGHRQVDLGERLGAPALSLSLPTLPEAARGRLGDGAVAASPAVVSPGQAAALPAPPVLPGLAAPGSAGPRPLGFGNGAGPLARPGAAPMVVQGVPVSGEPDATGHESGQASAR